jgi:chaperonin GroEL
MKKEADERMIQAIATVSANNDETIGKLIGNTYKKIGKHGTIEVELSHAPETTIEVIDGYQFDCGYLNEYFINSPKNRCELVDPYVMVLEGKISDVNQVFNLVNKVAVDKRSLLLIAEDFEYNAIATFVKNLNLLPCCLMKYNFLGETKRELMFDICAMTGAIVAEKKGDKLDSVDLSYLGSCEKIIVTDKECTIIRGKKNNDEVQKRIVDAETKISQAKHPFIKQRQDIRIAKLMGSSIAICRVGGQTEVEASEKKDRVDDSRLATKAAIEDGIVIGGGWALVRCASKLNLHLSPDAGLDVRAGITLVQKAIQEPARQILLNACGEADGIMSAIKKNNNPNIGYNALTDEIEDLLESGIVDPLKVVKVCLENAVSASIQALTSQALIVTDNS